MCIRDRPTGQSAYHCIHCDWVWFATWNSEGWSHINVEGIWKGGGLKPINSPDIAHRPPKPQKKATPDRSLKGPRNKKGSDVYKRQVCNQEATGSIPVSSTKIMWRGRPRPRVPAEAVGEVYQHIKRFVERTKDVKRPKEELSSD